MSDPKFGPWAVVTGGSAGLGLETARQLAEQGYSLVLVARREQFLMDVVPDLVRRGSPETRVVATDLSEPDSVSRIQAATADLDVGLLVHAAGFGTFGEFLGADLQTEARMLAVNCAATLHLTAAFGARFKSRGRGAVVLFGSLVGAQGTPLSAHYAATKAYVRTFAEGLAVEWRPHGIEVLVALPGPVHTSFAERASITMGSADEPPPVIRDILRALGRRSSVVPGGRGRFLTWALAPLPRAARVRIMGRVMEGMTLSSQVEQ